MKKRKVTYHRKQLVSRSGKPFTAIQTKIRYAKVKYQKPKGVRREALREEFKEKISKDFKRFISSKKKKNAKARFSLSVQMRHNFKGKRIRGGFQNKRAVIKNVDAFLNEYLEKFLDSMDKYLNRKDLNTISILGVKMEVMGKAKKRMPKNATRSKTFKTGRRTKKK